VVSTIDASIIVPESLHGEFEKAIRRDLDVLFPGVPVKTWKLSQPHFAATFDSAHLT
jgi:hypothetical protein